MPGKVTVKIGECLNIDKLIIRSIGVEGSQIWSGKNDWSSLNRQQNNTGALTWSQSLDVFICPAIF